MTAAKAGEGDAPALPERVTVIGAGLIGASVGLALSRRGVEVSLIDRAPEQAALAERLGAGRAVSAEAQTRSDVVLLCVPPDAVAHELKRVIDLDLGATYSDTASIKSQPLAQAEKLGVALDRFIGGHPIAGRERGGPAAARADLFLGRPWVLTPTTTTRPDAIDVMRAVVAACGAQPVVLDPMAHDQALALVSHAPQLLASVLASRLVDADETTVTLGGRGLGDLTRIANSDPDLWAAIGAGNAAALGAVLRGLADSLGEIADVLQAEPDPVEGGSPAGASAAVRAAVQAGNRGRARLPGKHGGRASPYTTVPVVIADEPGTLAQLLADVGAAGINVEDLALEHSPGAPVGFCELFVRPERAVQLTESLAAAGWVVHRQDDNSG